LLPAAHKAMPVVTPAVFCMDTERRDLDAAALPAVSSEVHSVGDITGGRPRGLPLPPVGQGRYAWLSPHGLALLVDHTGTRRIEPQHARMIIEAPPGLDLYPA